MTTTEQDTTEQVQTLGPVDPNAPWIAKVYSVVGSIGTIAGLLQTFHLITAEQSASIHTVGGDLITLVLSVVALIAGFRTHKQVKNGTFQKAPDPVVVTAAPPLSLSDVAQVRDELTSVITGAVKTAQGGLDQLAGIIPGGKVIAASVASVDDLIQAVRNHDTTT